MTIQIRSLGGHVERSLLAVFSRQTDDSVERHTVAPPFRNRTAGNAYGGRVVVNTMRLRMFAAIQMFQIHVFWEH